MYQCYKTIDIPIAIKKPYRPNISTSLIVKPVNPFFKVFSVFGRDEFIAMGADAFNVALLDFVFRKFPSLVSQSTKTTLLIGVGPVLEKVWFFVPHVFTGLRDYRTQPPSIEKRSPFYYMKQAFKGGANTLLWDVLCHDPIYVLSMYAGQKMIPDTPMWLISIASYLTGISLVVLLQVALKELQYRKLEHKLESLGFGMEHYYEARFCMEKTPETQNKIEEIRSRTVEAFQLNDSTDVITYHDRYIPLKTPEVSGRNYILRLRNRDDFSAGSKQNYRSVQIVFTRVNDQSGETPEQHRFFIAEKKKFYSILPGEVEMAQSLDDLKLENVKRFLNGIQDSKTYKDITFKRWGAKNEELYFAVDEIENGNGTYYIIEFKARKDKELLMTAMRELMIHLPVYQTTHNKLDLSDGFLSEESCFCTS